METYYITKYNPKFNKLQKSRDLPSLDLDNQEWKLYRQYKTVGPAPKLKFGPIQIAFLLYLIYVIIFFVANRLQ